jgi:hypothetical protein
MNTKPNNTPKKPNSAIDPSKSSCIRNKTLQMKGKISQNPKAKSV